LKLTRFAQFQSNIVSVPAKETHPVHRTASNATRSLSFATGLNSALTASLLACAALGLATGAFAASSDLSDYYAPRRAMARVQAEKKAAASELPSPLFAVISIADQRIAWYGGRGLVAQAPVSTGKRGHPTPTGVFAIVQKKRWHQSNIYSGAPMPFMQRITWSGIALHAGPLPGYPASHGCIRMPREFAQRIFGATRIGQRVVIAPRKVTPAEISHKTLPVPLLMPVDDVGEARAIPAEATATIAENAGQDGSDAIGAVRLTAAPAEVKRLNPEDYAGALKRDASEQVKTAARDAKAAQRSAVMKLTETRVAARKLASAQAALKSATDKLAAATRKAEKAEGEEEVAQAAEAKAAAEAAVADAQQAADAAAAVKDMRQQELAEARLAADTAKAAGKAASVRLAEANRRLKPLSVFISKKTGRLYVRQDFHKVFDAPVTISDPERPIGTHLYVGTGAAEDGASLTWMALSMPPEAAAESKSSRDGKGSRAGKAETAPPPADTAALPPETASGALDRIAIPEDTARRIAELSWVGASIIVSDHGISGETGDTTDFIILTRSRASAP
jgi:L,D-transpeptidase catalytic domain